MSLLRWLRRQLQQPTPLREHLEAAVENDDPAEARRLVATFEFRTRSGATSSSCSTHGNVHSTAGPVAQLVEQGTFNPKVAGSIPARPMLLPA